MVESRNMVEYAVMLNVVVDPRLQVGHADHVLRLLPAVVVRVAVEPEQAIVVHEAVLRVPRQLESQLP